MKRVHTITAARARRIVALNDAVRELPELGKASRLNKPRRSMDGDRVVVGVEVVAVSDSGGISYGGIQVDMVTGRKIIAAARRIVTSELKRLRKP